MDRSDVAKNTTSWHTAGRVQALGTLWHTRSATKQPDGGYVVALLGDDVVSLWWELTERGASSAVRVVSFSSSPPVCSFFESAHKKRILYHVESAQPLHFFTFWLAEKHVSHQESANATELFCQKKRGVSAFLLCSSTLSHRLLFCPFEGARRDPPRAQTRAPIRVPHFPPHH